MSIGKFYGASYPKLRLGNVITGPFEQIGNFHPVAETEFGTLLKYTANKLHYVPMVGDERDASLFAGIALVEKAGTPHEYPGTKGRYEIGEPGNVLKVGNAAVLFTTEEGADADVIREGGKVFLGTDGRVSTKAIEEEGIAVNLLPNLVFTGDIEGNGDDTLVGVRKLY